MIVKLIRPLEGMRALAVLAVLLFHLDIGFLPGGYLGVDVFFVISGYIISRNILKQLEEKNFSFLQFYTKRFRRLFPAMSVTVLATLVAAFFILPPSNLADLGEAGTWSLFSLANVRFWLEAGYFDVDADRKALLHMWSLGVEEQFYLFWPLLLIICRSRLFRIAMIAGLFAASIAAAVMLYDLIPNGVFFLFPFRIYQFATGAFLALVPLQIRKGGSVVTALAIGAFLAAIMVLAADTYTTVVSGLAAAVVSFLMLVSSESWLSQKALGNRVMVWIGSRSYVIYLAHWPIIVLYKHATGFDLDWTEIAGLFAASVIAGEILARTVEQPLRIRGTSTRPFNVRANAISGAALAVSIFLAANIWGNDGYPGRIDDDVQSMVAGNANIEKERKGAIRMAICHVGRNFEKSYQAETCINLAPKKTNVLVLGDSFSADTWMALDRTLPGKFELSQATQAGCAPLYPPPGMPGFPQCEAFNKIRFANYARKDWDVVVIAGQWHDDDLQYLEPTVRYLSRYARQVYVFGPRPQFQLNPVEALERAISADQLTADLNERVDLNKKLSAAMEEVAVRNGAVYFDMLAIQCPEDSCPVLDGEKLLYINRDHFSVSGADYFGKTIAKRFRGNLEK